MGEPLWNTSHRRSASVVAAIRNDSDDHDPLIAYVVLCSIAAIEPRDRVHERRSAKPIDDAIPEPGGFHVMRQSVWW